MISTSNDNEQIYFLLEASGNLFSDFSMDRVLAFDREDDFCVVVYSSAGRNFLAFTAKDHLQQTDALPALLGAIQEHSQDRAAAALLEQAAKLVEDRMHSKNNSRFYFDAH